MCSARAVAESLRLALGVAVDDAEVLDLYWSVADSADAGASISDVLGAVQRRGLHGFRPVRLDVLTLPGRERRAEPELADSHDEAVSETANHLTQDHLDVAHALILGVDWPQPHAVVLDDGLWWSWGEPYEPWTGEITEAWAVQWLP